MKRYLMLALLLVVFLTVTVSLATADDDPLVITPYNPYDGPDYYADVDQEVFIRAGWAACTKGLTQAIRHNALIALEVEYEGSPYLTLEPPSREYWGNPAPHPLPPDVFNCVLATKTMWTTDWLYPLGTLEAGVYDVHFLWFLEHPLPDGTDSDGDGHIDLHDEYYKESEITITVD